MLKQRSGEVHQNAVPNCHDFSMQALVFLVFKVGLKVGLQGFVGFRAKPAQGGPTMGTRDRELQVYWQQGSLAVLACIYKNYIYTHI